MSCGHTKFEGSPPCPCDWESVSLVDYGVLKERARIIALLEGSMSNGTSRGMRRAIKLIEGVDDE
jgi:hypothetical protein